MRLSTDSVYGVLWDMDGVLVDTGPFHYPAWVETLGREGVPFSLEMFRQTFGMNNRGVLTHVLGRAPEPDFLARVGDDKEASFRTAIHGLVRPLPGVVEWLTRLRQAGVKQAVASSAPQANIDALLDETGLRGYFDCLVSAYTIAGKPDPAVFLEAARQISVPPERCVVVEDAVAGVEAARRAGMACIAVTNTNPRERLAAADLVVDSLLELTEEAFGRLLDRSH